MNSDGKIIKIPYEIGTTVYGVFGEQYTGDAKVTYKLRVCKIEDLQYFVRSGNWLLSVKEVDSQYRHNTTMNKNVFLDVAQAEAKLIELQNGNHN